MPWYNPTTWDTPEFIEAFDPTSSTSLEDRGRMIVNDAGQLVTMGAVDFGSGKGWAEQGVDSAGRKIDQFGNYIEEGLDKIGGALGLTAGDASMDQFNKIWPYKEGQLNAARDAFENGGTLNPAFSPDTQNYIDMMRKRSAFGSADIDAARNRLNDLSTSSNPNSDFYAGMRNGRFGTDPAQNYLGQVGGREGQNPSNQYYLDIGNRNNDPGKYYFDDMYKQIGRNPSQQIDSQIRPMIGNNPAMTGLRQAQDRTGRNPAADMYRNIFDMSGNNPANNAFNNMERRIGNNPMVSQVNSMISQNNPTNQFYDQAMKQNFFSADPSTSYFANLGQFNNNPAMSQLNKTAQGGFLNDNPFLDKQFDRASAKVGDAFNKAANSIGGSFSSSGRYGSAAHQKMISDQQENLGDTLGNLATDIYGGNYQTERDRMLNASGQVGSLHNAGLGLQMNAAGQLGQNYNQGLDRQFNAAAGRSSNFASDMGLDYQGAGMIGDQYNRDTGVYGDLASGRSGIYQNNISNRMGAAAGLGDIYNNDTSNLINTSSRMGDVYQGDINNLTDLSGRADARYSNDQNTRLNIGNARSGMYNRFTDNLGTAARGLGENFNTDTNNIFRQGDMASGMYRNDIDTRFRGASGLDNSYQSDWQNRFSTIDPAFRFAANDYTDIGNYGLIGNMQDTRNKSIAMEPWDKIGYYGNAIGSVPYSSGGQQGGGNPLFALAGAGLGAWLAPAGGGVEGAKLGSSIGGLFGQR